MKPVMLLILECSFFGEHYQPRAPAILMGFSLNKTHFLKFINTDSQRSRLNTESFCNELAIRVALKMTKIKPLPCNAPNTDSVWLHFLLTIMQFDGTQ